MLTVWSHYGNRTLQAWVSAVAQQEVPSWWIEGLLVRGGSAQDKCIMHGSRVANINIYEPPFGVTDALQND